MAAVLNIGKEIRHDSLDHKAGEAKQASKIFERERRSDPIQTSYLLCVVPPEDSQPGM